MRRPNGAQILHPQDVRRARRARGIRVDAVKPGPIAISLLGKIGMDDAAIKGRVAQIPAGGHGDASEIAEAVVFLASDEAAFIMSRAAYAVPRLPASPHSAF
jgi:NAD(P)-dependent dehydrogenase (short-subunit alcohol dehydrogenase family)